MVGDPQEVLKLRTSVYFNMSITYFNIQITSLTNVSPFLGTRHRSWEVFAGVEDE
jgi:hypothetical protein